MIDVYNETNSDAYIKDIENILKELIEKFSE